MPGEQKEMPRVYSHFFSQGDRHEAAMKAVWLVASFHVRADVPAAINVTYGCYISLHK